MCHVTASAIISMLTLFLLFVKLEADVLTIQMISIVD